MTGRLLASVLWVPVVLTPALRSLVREAMRVVWPSIQPLGLLGELADGFVPLVTGVAVGYLVTALAAGTFISAMRASVDPVQRRWVASHMPDGWTWGGSALLLAAMAVGRLTGAWEWYWALAFALVMLGLIGGATPAAPATGDEAPLLPYLHPLPKPPVAHSEMLRHRWEWLSGGMAGSAPRTVAVDVVVPKSHYDELRGRDHSVKSLDDHASFARQGIADPAVGAIAAQIRQIAVGASADPLDEIHLVMAMAQSYTYASDQEEYGGEYPKYPVETLIERRGDCEDFAILSAALLGWLGHRVALVLMRTGDTGHAAIAVGAPQPIQGLSFFLPSLGVEVFYAEVTPPGDGVGPCGLVWKLGLQPHTDADQYAVYPIA